MMRRHLRPIGLLLVSSLFVVACGGGGSDDPAESASVRQSGPVHAQTVQSVSGQTYDYTKAGNTITVTAPKTNDPVKTGRRLSDGRGVIGEAFWLPGQKKRLDQQVCVSLDSIPDGSTLENIDRYMNNRSLAHVPGVALRVSGSPGEPTTAILVTPQTHQGAIWIFSVVPVKSDVAGTSASAAIFNPTGLDFSDAVGEISGTPGKADFATTLKPPPWNICARAVGTKISVMVWADGEKQPDWSDSKRVREVNLSRRWVYSSYAGAYEQALSPGRSSKFSDLDIKSPYGY